jgi:hypothetical protein
MIYSVQVCSNGEGQQHDAGYHSVSSDNIISYMYVFKRCHIHNICSIEES